MTTPSPPPRSNGSLARSTLLKMGVPIAALIGLTTFFSYLHMVGSLRTAALSHLEKYVSERAKQEQALFMLAADNHTVLKKALAERIQALRQEDPAPRFETLFARRPDGTVRSRAEHFDGTRMPGVFIAADAPLDEELRRRILAAYDVLAQYGPALHTRFTNTYITLPEKLFAIYWPESPSWVLDAETAPPLTSLELFTISLPENNPQRQTAWCGIFADTVIKSWMVSVSTPLDLEGRHVATISHDVLLKELMVRTLHDRLPGSYNLIFRDDGLLIAHPELMTEDAVETHNILETAEQAGPRAHLRSIFEQVRRRQPGQIVLENEEGDTYLAVARLEGPQWNLVTVLPRSEVTGPAWLAARYVLWLGLLALLVGLGIMYLVMKLQITRPLKDFNQAADQVAAGDFIVRMNTARNDELGQLARAFQLMANGVQQREEALREANEGLEQRVLERTRELKDVHHQLVESARQAGMAEIATNVLHNVGNVLNSVQTSTLLVTERLGKLKLASVRKVAALLEQHQGDLPDFLTQDNRGRMIPSYLNQLGQSLEEERERIHSLLGDLGRYTEHIGSIVNLQQSYARPPQALEFISLGELIDDALRINAAGLSRHEVRVEKHLAELPPVLTDKHKVLMILVNLISNAKYALDEVATDRRHLTLRLEHPEPEQLLIRVSDNGVGIAPEMLTRIFEYGYTTRTGGHGFGLHSSAIAAQVLGGSLTAHSDGPGRGATFKLKLPYTPGGV
ncbi:ATP-binding protein [Hyalangium sp.]|uniref:ATP-binding protein n=1 Tax=Hyalangium sp. TaxID=2028555 RepID=UPI002D732DE2|nr:ATP-binding protein [Hyalangium sp.]HYH99116.1 ATP-binding protein [Hyalangium sp.]